MKHLDSTDQAACIGTIRALFAESRSLLAICDTRTKRLSGNAAFEYFYEVDAIGNFYELFDAKDHDLVNIELLHRRSFHGTLTLDTRRGRFEALVHVESIGDEGKRPTHYIAVLEPLDAEKALAQQDLFFHATHDVLTKLPNRLYFHQKLTDALHRSIRNRTEGALFFIDLDNFKTINDTLGHEAGDRVLIEAAERLTSLLRESDIVARFGGDEFLLLVEPVKNEEALMYLARRIIEAFNEPFVIEGIPYHVGTSIGIALFPKDGRDVETLLKNADNAMYRAKKEGKHGFRFYTDAIDDDIKRHYQIEQILIDALQKNSFYLLFQPQIDLMGGKVIGFEALLRLRTLLMEDISPAEFIPIAEESDLIIKIGRWVFEECCRQLKEWESESELDDFIVSINLSHRQLLDEEWLDFVQTTLSRYGVPPRRIEFEVTEKTLTKAGEKGLETIRKMRQLGCGLSIDDFGSGHSSLTDLKRYAFQRLKIDRAIIENLQDEAHHDIVKASIAVADALGLEALAKGVENGTQKDILENLGCEKMQGFLMARPLEKNEVPEIVRKEKD